MAASLLVARSAFEHGCEFWDEFLDSLDPGSREYFMWETAVDLASFYGLTDADGAATPKARLLLAWEHAQTADDGYPAEDAAFLDRIAARFASPRCY